MDLPDELYNLDILDGSPPCSTFSMAGSRDNAFKKEKVFREGQAKQVLSDLFFDWIKLVDKLQPKVAIAENVKGMLAGNAKAYTKKILQELDKIGYEVQLFLVNAKDVGLPQARERVFFICKRKDLKLPKMKLAFNDKEVGVKTAFDRIKDINYKGSDQTKSINFKYWEMCKPGESFKKYHPKGSLFSLYKMPLDKPSCTITATSNNFYHWESMRNLSKYELCMLGSYPIDYDFLDNEPGYLIGMSVPPILAGRIAQEVAKQIFKK
jgi:DNA (cytosine-5)-methyltransferase 1